MSKEIERYRETDDWAPMMPKIANLAKYVSGTEFVPRGLRDRPAAVAAAILTGREIGLPPMTAMAHIDVIEGMPTMDPEMMRALVLREGHSLRFVEMTKTRCVIEARRKGDSVTTRVTFTIDEAKEMGLAGKKNWREQPQNMLVARCTARTCRLVFPDVIGGLSYTPDEMIGTVEESSDLGIETETQAPAPAKLRRSKAVAAAPEALPEPEVVTVEAQSTDGPPLSFEIESETEPEVIEAEVEMVTSAMLKKIATLFGKLGVADRDDRLEWVAGAIGRGVSSSKELTKTEAMMLIDRQEKILSGEPVEPFDDPFDEGEIEDGEILE